MSLRLRIVEGARIALCAATCEEREGDIYLDDEIHHALSTKFGMDFYSEGFLEDPLVDARILPLMLQEQGGKLDGWEKYRIRMEGK